MRKLNIKNVNTTAPKIYQAPRNKPNKECKKLPRKLQSIIKRTKAV